MFYDPKTLDVKTSVKRTGNSVYAVIVAHNRSNIGIKEIAISYQRIGKGDLVEGKHTHSTYDISPGEKRRVLDEQMFPTLGQKLLQITRITVVAVDGSSYNINPPTDFVASSCFVATAAFGNQHDPAVVALRYLRDEVLIDFWIGRHIVKIYEDVGPCAANLIIGRPKCCYLSRTLLAPLVLFSVFLKKVMNRS